jgi:hypothetical protein
LIYGFLMWRSVVWIIWEEAAYRLVKYIVPFFMGVRQDKLH